VPSPSSSQSHWILITLALCLVGSGSSLALLVLDLKSSVQWNLESWPSKSGSIIFSKEAILSLGLKNMGCLLRLGEGRIMMVH